MKAYFITTASMKKQLPKKGMYELLGNELFKDEDGSIYLAWKGFRTDDFTWIDAEDWDTRCSHIHDVGCKYHQVVKVILTEQQLWQLRLLEKKKGEIICKNIPACYLVVKDCSGHWINNLFYRMLKYADCPKTPKYVQWLYRTGVCLNFNWFFTGKQKIDLNKLYNPEWNED